MRKSDLPFGCQFSASQIQLETVLRLARDHSGDQAGFEQAVKNRFFATHAPGKGGRDKLANNTFLSLKEYGIVREDAHLTPFGDKLVSLLGQPLELRQELARHILLQLRGLEVIETMADMQAAKEDVNLVSLRRRLIERGTYMPAGSTHFSSMKSWLAEVGIFAKGRGYSIDRESLKSILGTSIEEVEALSELTVEQRYFLKALANLDPKKPARSNEVAALAASLYGVHYNEKALPQQVLFPLQAASYITISKTTSGRGAKPHEVTPTDRFEKEVLLPLIDSVMARASAPPRRFLRMSLEELLSNLGSHDRNIKGKALESLAIYFMRLLDLRFVRWWLRAHKTGAVEVHAEAESTNFLFHKWQLVATQPALSLDGLARAVGFSRVSKPEVILAISAGDVSEEGVVYAHTVSDASKTRFAYILSSDLKRISRHPGLVAQLLRGVLHLSDASSFHVSPRATRGRLW